uniref:NADH-ubiquinone oxidoreductase chain 5 n=1 Tax=Trybliographa sp. ZJUH 20220008 TaxID=2943454 RepID=A0A9E8GB41_9HYME|nr:NADH dehydrogenase subunit 5 [Trybliographa sp. ZJUH 20220008]
MLNLLYSFLLITPSLNLFLFSIFFLIKKKIFIIEWSIITFMNYTLEFMLYLDWMTLMFLSVVMFISSMVMTYSKEYMQMELKNKYFIMILMMFVVSMMLMIVSPNIFSIILGWDGLGLISYCLIIYYQNYSSFNSGMITLLTNRIGDITLLLMIFLMMNMNSWNLMIFNFNNLLFTILLLIMIMTKSAQTPFSMWLPAAMAAPTPVSSLVHSSTLVTAGIYLLIRFNKIFLKNNLNIYIMIIGMTTMLISSTNALFEFDLKKIIALSTLSQLGLMMMMLSMNMPPYVFFHLISHAMFKSLLFLCSGIMIHTLNNSQDIRTMGTLIYETPLLIILFNFSNLSLCGIPFLSGFFSKDLMFEMILNFNFNSFIYPLMYLSITLTILYSFRLMYYLTFNMNMNLTLNLKNDNFLMSISIYPLFLMSIIFGNMINWILFSTINFSIINLKIKMHIFFMMNLSLMIFIIMKLNLLNMKLYLIKMIMMMSTFFFLMKISTSPSMKFIPITKILINNNESMWNEYYGKYKIKMILMTMFNSTTPMFINLIPTFFTLLIYIIIMQTMLM